MIAAIAFAVWTVVATIAGLVIGLVIRVANHVEEHHASVEKAQEPLYVPSEWVA